MKTIEFNEIVFEGRNHEYGAYILRKSYKKRMTIAVSIGIIMLLMVVSYPLIAGYLNKARFINNNTEVIADFINNKPIEDVAPPPPPPPPPLNTEKYVHFTAPVIVDEDSVDTNFGNDPDKIVNKPIDTTETINTVDSAIVKKPKIIEDLSDVLLNVQEMPEYPGGESAMMKFIADNIVYPTIAKESNISGTVYIKFVVEPTGNISNITLLRGIGGTCDEEAIRVVKMLPKWSPGKQNGNAVRVWFTLPIKFTLI